MFRTLDDAIKDQQMLAKLHIGDKIQFNSPGAKNHNQIGTIASFRHYEGDYGTDLPTEYRHYTSVMMELENGKQLSVSPRNVVLLSKDVVEVVRCKNCKHSKPLDRTKSPYKYYKDSCIMCTCEDVVGDEPMVYLPNHFCSYGEEK